MELTGTKWENYSTKSVDHRKQDKYWIENHPDECVLKTASLGEMRDKIEWMIKNANMNHKNIYDIPFLIEYDNKQHVVETAACGHGSLGMICSLQLSDWDKLVFTAPDTRPEKGEFWTSRGATSFDCSGFVVSKLAGERLRRMVNCVLEKDETKSWLDYRDYDPNWIQYKFSAEEFDVEKLDEKARENNNILTEDILRECVKEA